MRVLSLRSEFCFCFYFFLLLKNSLRFFFFFTFLLFLFGFLQAFIIVGALNVFYAHDDLILWFWTGKYYSILVLCSWRFSWRKKKSVSFYARSFFILNQPHFFSFSLLYSFRFIFMVLKWILPLWCPWSF